MMKKVIAYLLFAMCMVVMFSACGGGDGNTGNDTEKPVYDDNSQIVQDGDNFEMDEYASEELDSGYKLTLTGFNGVKNIYLLTAKEDGTVSVSFDLKTSGGKFKCVYVNTSGDIEIIVEQNGSDTAVLNVAKGESSIKIVGLDGNLELTTNVQNSDGNVEVEYIN